MDDFRKTINSKLNQCEAIRKSINTLMIGLEDFEKTGGVAKVSLYLKDGVTIENVITKELLRKIINILISDYNALLESTLYDIGEEFEKGWMYKI